MRLKPATKWPSKAIAAKSYRKSSLLRGRRPGIVLAGWLRTACLALPVMVGCAGIAREASAIFVTPPEKKAAHFSTTQPESTEAKGGVSADNTSREDTKLQRQLRQIAPVPVEKRKVNSNTFSRMSGQTEKLKPVTLPTSSVKTSHRSATTLDERFDTPEKMINIGCWAFILACIGAAAIGLFKIKKLASSG